MENKKKIHPGSGRRNALTYNKGRHADDASIEELMNLIPNDFFRQRDMLIESFHLIQDHEDFHKIFHVFHQSHL